MGISPVRMSRIIPPATPVMTPMMTAVGPDSPVATANWVPLMVKTARPSASAIRSDRSGGRRERR